MAIHEVIVRAEDVHKIYELGAEKVHALSGGAVPIKIEVDDTVVELEEGATAELTL